MLTARQNPLSTGRLARPEHAVHDVSMYEWMRSLGLNDRSVKLGYGINVSYGEDAHDVSALQLLFRAAFSTAQRRSPATAAAPPGRGARASRPPVISSAGAVGYTAADGVQRIPEAMAESLACPVHFGSAVRRIEDDGRLVTVGCQDGTEFKADHAVCGLPFTVLRHIDFDPPLQGVQCEAVSSLPSQPMTQFYFAHKSEFWEADGFAPSLFTDTAAGMFSAIRNGSDPTEITGFSAWVMGRNAARLDMLPPEAAGARVLGEIEAVRPAAREKLEFIGRQSWGTDPFARGAWAYFRPGRSPLGAAWVRPTASCFAASTWAEPTAAWRAPWSPASEPRRESLPHASRAEPIVHSSRTNATINPVWAIIAVIIHFSRSALTV